MTKKLVFDPSDVSVLPQGTTHLHGTFFRIPFSAIKVPDELMQDEDSEEYKFCNPRGLTRSGANDLVGKKSSNELRESIKKRTLLNPMVCRWQQEGNSLVPMLVGGDRRYRALDYLIKHDVEVADPRNCKYEEDGKIRQAMCSAREAYNTVVCQVFAVNDDLEALAISWAENKNRINLTDGHEVAEVIKLRKHNATDAVILEILQRDEKWLAETDRIISKADQITLDNLLENRINRSAAINLLEIPDEAKREQILSMANQLADEKHKQKKEKVDKLVEMAKSEMEEAQGQLVDCEFLDDEEGVEEAKEAIEKANQKVKKSTKKRDSLKSTTTTRDVNKAKNQLAEELDLDQKMDRVLSARKIKHGIDYLKELIRDDGACQHGKFKADTNSVQLLIRILEENVLSNDADFPKTLESHFAKAIESTIQVLEEAGEEDSDEDMDNEFKWNDDEESYYEE